MAAMNLLQTKHGLDCLCGGDMVWSVTTPRTEAEKSHVAAWVLRLGHGLMAVARPGNDGGARGDSTVWTMKEVSPGIVDERR
ncbi:hypothetical protein M0R45_030861 [Rubus argutus]|uniref:Uncharacterized protein n=1 Tax=Rubus argutus TaxID=59490 RepID=A0AAW1WCL4_RUBAR